MTSIDINNIISTISDLQNKQRILEQHSNEYKQQLIIQKEENNKLKRKLDEQLSHNKRIKNDDFKFSDIDLYGYYPHNKVNMVMAV